ncbi:PREDICTED: proline-, glutamic acid- and leucine-rich protein 1 [Nanorana parkeri]|uniref:proline-, glutamic acid- and leucine-rich protein 1 n=1 Tax=Nanorana parkeri TaxID=125878 RepID=UPI0008545116|nr:PREDICTED: proline-, glutamic acid- and leucine-rich protein 1 [Nanorana parkeri]
MTRSSGGGGGKMAAVCVGFRMMEAVVNGLLEKELSEGELAETIRGLREHGALRGEGSSASLPNFLASCSSRLVSGSTRIEGLSLLSLLVEESPTDVFQQHCISWIRSVLQVIQSQDPPRVISLAVFVLRSLLTHSSALPELSREISTNHIPGLLTSLLGLRPQCLMPALEGIRCCMITYPRACGSLRGKLTAFFLSLLDEESLQVQELACQCFSLLPSLGSGFSQGVKHTENWERQMHSVLCSLHTVFQQLYQSAETAQSHKLLLNLLNREQFPAPVRAPVSDILNLVCRVVNVSAKNLSWQGEEAIKLLVLPRVHLSALDILESTIVACGPRLLPFSTVICRLFPQLLSSWAAVRGASGIPPGQERPYSALRGAVYRVLERWVTMCGVSSGVLQGMSHHSDVLLAHLLSDINPPTDNVKISGFVQLGAKKQKVSDMVNGDFQSHRKRETSANTELCIASLRALCSIILYGGSLIKDDTHRRLQEFSIPLLLRLQQGSDQWVGPYISSDCRKQLYRLLLSLILTPSPRLPAPLHCAIRIFRGGITEESQQVSMFCTEALAICRLIIHPRVPTLQRPLPQHGPRPQQQPETPTQRLPVPARPLIFPAPPPVNHLPVRTPVPPQPIEPPAVPAVQSPQETFGKTAHPIFVHYEKEEASDVEISLESDSDDSVVIVPKGFLQKPVPKSEPSPPSVKPPAEEAAEVPAPANVPSPSAAALPQQAPPPLTCPGPSAPQVLVATEAPPPPPPPAPPSEGDMVININSTDDEEEEEDDEEGMYDEDEDEYYDDEEEEDLEGIDDDEEEDDFEDEECMSEEDEEEEDLDAEDDEEEEVEDEEGLMHEDMQLSTAVEAIQDQVQEDTKPVIQEPESEEGPPRLSPVQDEGGDTDLLMVVESEDRENPEDDFQDRDTETEVTSSPSAPPVLSPPPPPRTDPEPSQDEDTAEPEDDYVSESEPPIIEEPEEEEPVKELQERKVEVLVEEEEEEEEEEMEEMRDAESMLADFIDCPPDEDEVQRTIT